MFSWNEYILQCKKDINLGKDHGRMLWTKSLRYNLLPANSNTEAVIPSVMAFRGL